MLTHPGEKFSQWWLAVGVGGVVTCLAGLARVAWPEIPAAVIPYVGLLGVTGSLVYSQTVYMGAWVTSHQWDIEERRIALEMRQPPTIAPNPEAAADPEGERLQEWRGALALFLQHAERVGGLTARKLTGVAVGRPDDWQKVTDALVDAGVCVKYPDGTRLKERTYAAAVVAVMRLGADELPPDWPPRIAPLSRPADVVLEHSPAGNGNGNTAPETA